MAETQPVVAAAGERHAGELRSELPLLQGWSWPYVTIHGKQDGPRTTIVAGIHGCEYVSIRAAVRLSRELDPAALRGQVLVVPVVNLPTFWERRAFFTPEDGKNLNRVFPGSATGTFTEQLAYFIFNSCMLGRDAFLDLHGGDLVEQLLPFTGYLADAAPEVAATGRRMAEAFGLPFTMERRTPPGAPRGGMTYVAAAQHGVPGLLAEAGGNGFLTPPDVDLLVEGSRRVLQALGNLPGTPQAPPTRVAQTSNTLLTPVSGFWMSPLKAGDEVRSGQEVGQILDLLGNPLQAIQAPFDGTILYRTTAAAVREGGILMSVVA